MEEEKSEESTMDVIEEHDCVVLERHNERLNHKEIKIQRFSNFHWYWISWRDAFGNVIAFCPYCGKKL